MSSIRKSIDSTSTIIRQQEQQSQHQHQEDYNYNNIIITTRSQACSSGEQEKTELPGNEIMEQIAEAYRANIAPVITQAAALVIENALKSGMEPATVILGIEETGMASRPSPYYLRAVLRNWAEYGIATSKARDKWQRTDARPWWR